MRTDEMLKVEDIVGELRAENERLRAALKPFAELGEKLRTVCQTGAIPPGSSARFLKLDPLTAQSFVDAADAIEQAVGEKAEEK